MVAAAAAPAYIQTYKRIKHTCTLHVIGGHACGVERVPFCSVCVFSWQREKHLLQFLAATIRIMSIFGISVVMVMCMKGGWVVEMRFRQPDFQRIDFRIW